jgi:hypothetical protein
MNSLLHRAAILAVFALSTPALAADGPETFAAAVPAEVSEVVSGGTWSEGSVNGVYRAIVVATPTADGQEANVVVQMLSLESAEATPKVIKTILIKEIAEKKLANAFLAMDAETENEMTLIVTAYGAANDQDTSIQVKFDGTGKYEVLPVGGEDAPAGAAAGTKK